MWEESRAAAEGVIKIDKIMPEDASLNANREQFPHAALMCDSSTEAEQAI